LFRSRSTRKSTDELLVVITPRFVKPVPASEVNLPETMETFLPTVPEQKSKNGKKTPAAKPEFVGPRGRIEPK
jgi:Flp pilus assembly secretin CpaC